MGRRRTNIPYPPLSFQCSCACSYIMLCFGVHWVMFLSIGHVLSKLAWITYKKKEKENVENSFVLFWTIWKEKNMRTFKNIETQIKQLNNGLQFFGTG